MKREVESEIEQTDMDDISRLIDVLKQAEAPRNFEHAVMARIADGARVSRRVFGMSRTLAYALPIVLVAIVGIAIFVATRRTASPQPDLADAGESQFVTTQAPSTPASSPSPEQTTIAANPPIERKAVASTEPPAPANSAKRKQRMPPGGGSIDEAVNEERAVTPAAPSRPFAANRDEVVSSNPVPVRDILLTLGITAEYNGGWIVRRVAANSQAEHSGLKAGDVVIALGETTLNDNTEFKGQFSASIIRVRRDGQELQLGLK